AKALTEANGGHFVAILQPVSFVGTPRRDYIPPSPVWERVYLQAYDHLRQMIEKNGNSWAYDLSGAFDGTEPLYIDQMHVTGRGNDIMANAIMRTVGIAESSPAVLKAASR